MRRDLSSGCVTAAASLLQACAKFLEASSAYVASHAPSRAPARVGEVPVTQDPRAHPPGFTGRQGTAIFDAPLCVPLPLQARRLAEADCGVAASRFVVTTLTQLVHRGTRIFFAEVVSTLHSNAWHRLPDGFSVHEVFMTTKSGTGSSNYTEFMVPFIKVRIMTGQCIPIVLCTLEPASSLIGLWKW